MCIADPSKTVMCFCSIPTGGIPLRLGVVITTPIEVNCTGSEQTIQECQLIRQSLNVNAAGVNCTGMYVSTKVCE